MTVIDFQKANRDVWNTSSYRMGEIINFVGLALYVAGTLSGLRWVTWLAALMIGISIVMMLFAWMRYFN